MGSVFAERFGWVSLGRSQGVAFDFTKNQFPNETFEKALLTFSLDQGSETHFNNLKSWLRLNVKETILYSATSAFVGCELDEETPLVQTTRFLREEELRKEGAMVLHLAGIYSKERSPLTWLQKGLIPAFRNSVRLIHREDILKITHHFFANFQAEERFILSDGINHLWEEIIALGMTMGEIPEGFQRPITGRERPEKFISNEKLKGALGEQFSFLSLEKGLTTL